MSYAIFPHSSCFRPYFIGSCELGNIIFYSENGPVIESGRGFLVGCNKEDLPRFELEKTPYLKRKFDFKKMYNTKETFYVKIPKDRYSSRDKYTLYVPYITEEWDMETYTEEYGIRRAYNMRFTNTKHRFIIEKLRKAEDIPEKREFVDKVTEIAKLMVTSESSISEITIINNRDKIIEAIKAFTV